ncbi:hypothetical protein [uncultured Dysgonomonas sp.]|uniref:hypothetical protein n=1 Tax=uncultured Dysgonomonas sp. TaxID=206096 RepID=UPI00262168A8|nr:hypothetical protein [uncultured Dysgonomonas sp.]
MDRKNSFYVLYPKNNRLKNFLNSIKLLCDYNQRTEAHITVRGPYKNKIGEDFVTKWSNIISGEILHISFVENFFPFGQNTVFFRCEDNNALRKVWNKLTYNDFKPHITMYDGKNKRFAIKLYNLIASDFEPFLYEVDKLSYLEPKNPTLLDMFSLKNNFDYSFYKEILDIDIDLEILKKISEETRLLYIKSILRHLKAEFNTYNYKS